MTDPSPGEPATPAPEFRKDPVTGGWVIFAPERSRRPEDLMVPEVASTPREGCPFCPARDGDNGKLEIIRFPPTPDYGGQPWTIKVLKDKFPILSDQENYHRFGDGMYDLMSGHGHHELVVESPLHDDGFPRYPDSHVRDLLSVYQNRSLELSSFPNIRQILITRNSGHDAGAQISHPHSHIVGMPIIPKRIQEEVSGCQGYYRFKERCVYCDIIAQEREDGSRIVLDNDCFVAFTAWAARFPYEVVIAPRVHLSRFETIRPNEIVLLADIMKGVISAIKGSLPRPSLNYIFHTSPTPQARTAELTDVAKYYHWHIEIIPKITRIAGFEWGSGFYINPVMPEDSAASLRGWLERQKQLTGAFPFSRTQPDAPRSNPRPPVSAQD